MRKGLLWIHILNQYQIILYTTILRNSGIKDFTDFLCV